MGTATNIRRSALHQLVWEQPMLHLAKTYGLSDVGLAKICRKHDIPCPPRGYWAKKQHGQTPRKAPLPRPDQDDVIELRDGTGRTDVPPAVQDEIRQSTLAEQCPEMRIAVGDTLRGCHELVSRANEELQAARVGANGLIDCPKDAALNVVTSKVSLRRALLIMDALLKALERRGHTVRAGPIAVISGAEVRFAITEALETRREQADDHSLEGRYEFGHSRFREDRVPSGRLTLAIVGAEPYWFNNARRTWRDTGKRRIEDLLNAFVVGLVEIAALARRHREEEERRAELQRHAERERQEQARILAEKRQLQKAEQARVDRLLSQAETRRMAVLVRELIEAVKREPAAFAHLGIEGSVDEWIAWATQQADRLDPLAPSPRSILDERLGEERPQTYFQEVREPWPTGATTPPWIKKPWHR